MRGFEDIKFDARKFRKEFLENDKLRFALFSASVPILEKQLSRVDPNEAASVMSELEVLQRLEASQKDEVFEEVAS
ncbi:hypothetical protein D3C76_1762680 [compost metagenome]